MMTNEEKLTDLLQAMNALKDRYLHILYEHQDGIYLLRDVEDALGRIEEDIDVIRAETEARLDDRPDLINVDKG